MFNIRGIEEDYLFLNQKTAMSVFSQKWLCTSLLGLLSPSSSHHQMCLRTLHLFHTEVNIICGNKSNGVFPLYVDDTIIPRLLQECKPFKSFNVVQTHTKSMILLKS